MRMLLLLSALLSALTGAMAGARPFAAPVARHAPLPGERRSAAFVVAAPAGGHRHLLGAFGQAAGFPIRRAVPAIHGARTPPLYSGRLRA